MTMFIFDVVVSTVLASLVLDDSLPAIGLMKGVDSLGFVVVPSFPLTLDVVVFQIMNGIVPVIMGRCLRRKRKSKM